ncbi:hypothetical protein CANINC_003670 [Pichia inconspicua]|uniref:Nuclear control of ATPase protein 2 n=1 Tax=Pichia inconspicua TaxID=52247 RepID=A0A4V4NFF9_9ASCO|nr:hypothetical protein CANINC_003670 [[Candida] inconspicua]
MSVLTPQRFVASNLESVQEKATFFLSNIEQFENEDSTLKEVKKIVFEVYDIGEKYSKETAEDIKLSSSELTLLLNCAEVIKSGKWLESTDDNIKGLAEISILYITVLMITDTSKYLIDSTLDTLNDISYYDRVLSRTHLVILYLVQNLPHKIADFFKEVSRVNIKKSVDIPGWMPEYGKKVFTQLMLWTRSAVKLINDTVETFIKSPTTFIIEKQRASRSLLNNFWYVTFKLPYFYSSFEIEKKRKNLICLKKDNITKLGYLFLNVPSYENNKLQISVINHTVGLLKDNVYEFNSTDGSIDSLIEFIKTRPEILHQLEVAEKSNTIPSYWTRTWPLYVSGGMIALSYAPTIIYNIHLLATSPETRRECFDYFKGITLYIYDTGLSFWNNWIIEPVNNILKTIRHDDQSEIALMSQKSLETDLKSLERMVLEYVEDAHLEVADKNVIIEKVKYGDLDIIMSEYEKELKTPVKSILVGDMLRNLLIQIQKTKVDGTLALNGVDKILKSQELVFGFVAASPSILILVLLKNTFMSWYRGENAEKNEKLKHIEICTRVCESLGSIEKLIDQMVVGSRNENHGQDCYKIGLLFIEAKNLKKLAVNILPTYVYETFCCDIDELISQDVDIEYKLLSIQRIWNVYGFYFK